MLVKFLILEVPNPPICREDSILAPTSLKIYAILCLVGISIPGRMTKTIRDIFWLFGSAQICLDPQLGEISTALSLKTSDPIGPPWLLDPHAASGQRLGASTQPCHMLLSESPGFQAEGTKQQWFHCRKMFLLAFLAESMSIHWDHVVGYPKIIQRTHDVVMLWRSSVDDSACAWCMTIRCADYVRWIWTWNWEMVCSFKCVEIQQASSNNDSQCP